jgi:hypothetical protein
MSKYLSSTLMRLALAAVCVTASASCGGELLRTGRSPVYFIVNTVSAAQGNTPASSTAFLLSDVRADDGSVFNDNVTVDMQIDAKNVAATTTSINSVSLTRYHVEYRRSDGRNTPGVDVPYGFDGAVSGTLFVGGSFAASFEVVRHQAKREPPLANMTSGGGLRNLDVIAMITIYGRDQNGNELKVDTQLDIHFADFAG